MKEYKTAEIEILKFDSEDIITDSGWEGEQDNNNSLLGLYD